MWPQSLKKKKIIWLILPVFTFFLHFEAKLNKFESESDIFLCIAVFLNVSLPIKTFP